MSTQQVEPKTIYVRNVAYATVGADLAKGFERFGKVQSARIGQVSFRGQRVSAGYGFVEFATEDACKAALECKEEISVGGRRLIIRPARPRRQYVRDTVFIRGIPESVTDETLKQAFAKYNPSSVRLIRKNKDGQLGFAFVQLDSEEHAKEAIDAKTIQLGGAESQVRMARPKPKTMFRRRRNTRRRGGPGRRAPRAPAPEQSSN